MGLNGNVIYIADLKPQDVNEMFALMHLYYQNITKANFTRDLLEKQWVILLKNENGAIKGFSTMMIMDIPAEGEIVKAVFSGDTIIDRAYWGEISLQVIWSRFVLMDIPAMFPENKVYWILITKGYKTYRYLPRYFLEFYPQVDCTMPPFEKTVIDTFGHLKYPGRYNHQTGIIYATADSESVKEGVADVTAKHLTNPHIRYFIERNPGYVKGDELVCITRAALSNLEPEIKSIIENGR